MVLAYPLTPVPLTQAHIDGTKITTDKPKLFGKLEKRITTDAPKNVDVCIVDGMFLVQSAMRSESFKTWLLRFLAEEWARNEYASVLKTCELYFGLDEVCCMYKVVDGQMTRQEILELKCQHEEANTHIALHVKQICEHIVLSNIVVRCTDTDVLDILLLHMN